MRDVSVPVDFMEWHPEKENILLSYHVGPTASNGLLALWNTKDAALLWTRPVHDCAAALSLQFSPFEPETLAFATANGSIFVVRDLGTGAEGTKVEPEYHVNGQMARKAQQGSSAQQQ